MAEVDPQLADAWQRMMALFFSRRDAFFAELATLQLTPPHGHALMTLHDGPVRMRDLADSMACDASYVTAVADRLEQLGFAERRNAPDDRRVRELVLTAKGTKVAQRLRRVFSEPPDAMQALPAADRTELLRIMSSLGEPAVDGWLPTRSLR
ncbi:MAG: MarR family transcriptional regulator [Actinomycetota bacterium]|nr:MarR family transcriptional regulator [Actinomycetota bacterium]